MPILEQMEDLQRRAESLCTLYEALRPGLLSLEAAAERGAPLDKETGETVRAALTRLLEEQRAAEDCCTQLSLPVPETWSALAEELRERTASLAEQARYQSAADFFMGLRAETPEVQAALERYQTELRETDTLSSETLERYIQFQTAFSETDQQQRFYQILQISRLFDPDLAFGLNAGVIQTGEGAAPPVDLPDIPKAAEPSIEGPAQETPGEGSSDEPAEPAEMESWRELGITDPAPLTVSVEGREVHVRRASNEKPFGVKTFKREMSRPDRREMRSLLMLADQYGCVTPEPVARVLKLDVTYVRNVCERLLESGYFVWCELEDFGGFYALSAKGEQIFTSKESAALLKSPRRKPNRNRKEVEQDANVVLLLSLSQQFYSWVKHLENADAYSCGTTPKWVLQRFEALGRRQAVVGYLCCGARTPEEFINLQAMMQESPTLDLLIVVGIHLDHARAVAAWVKEQYSDKLTDTEIWYMEPFGRTCRTWEGEEADLDAFLAAEADTPEAPPEPPEETEPPADEPEELPAEVEAPEEIKEPAEKKPEANDVLPEERWNEYRETALQMLAEGKLCCATAWLRTLSLQYPGCRPYWLQLAYALNDPLAECSYSSDRLFQVYFSDSTGAPDAFLAAAALRSCFLNQCGYDYQLDQLWDAVAKRPVLEENVDLNQVLYRLKKFKSTYHRGIDAYADYRQKKREAFEQTMSAIRAEARSLYQNNILGRAKEQASQKRFLETKKYIFSPQGELAEFLQMVQQDDREALELLEDFLRTQYIKDGEAISADAIDSGKIDRILNEAWEAAGSSLRIVKRSSDLMGSLRTNLSKMVRRTAAVLCDYVYTLSANTVDENDPGLAAYRRARSPLLQHLRRAMDLIAGSTGGSWEDQSGRRVLFVTLDELRQRLDGSFEDEASRYFYLPFLQWDEVLLDENYLPILHDVQEVEELSVLSRIRRHAAAGERPLEERLWEILDNKDEWGGDYGSARLLLAYFRSHPGLIRDRELPDPENGIGFADPGAFLEGKRSEFVAYLELAQSYGQIDNAEGEQKETMLQIMNGWCDWTLETHNFGFCKKIFAALRSKIEKDARARAQDLTASLAVYQKENPNWEEKAELGAVIREIQERIRVQNYTAAEDLLNRLNANDLDTELAAAQTDYLQEFLREYSANAIKAGNAGNNLQANLTRERNKDAKGARRLIENWPKSINTPAVKIQELLEGLGFPVQRVQSETPIHGKDHYQVYLRHSGQSGYKHPVSVFGSEAETKGFRLVNLFGRMDAGRLIDTFREIGGAKHTLILLDYALTLADRRELARRTKTEFPEKTFAVIDRVVLVYLASHYSETAVNRMLMAVTLPFAACRLYQPNSSQDMPPELFIGRKNELEKIKAPGGVNIVYGGRQLGKTALLRKAQKDVDRDENGDRAIWIDIKFKDYREAARKISAALYDEGILKTEHITSDWDELARDIKNRLRDTKDPIPYLLLLLDEADTFIESCGAVKFQPFDALKDIQGVGANRFKFVVAGLHNVVRFQRDLAISDNIGLTHLSSLTVTPFKYREARELLEVPLSYLGFRFPDNEETARLVSTIFTTTNYFPGLLQLYCSKLIEALQRSYGGYSETEVPPYVVKEDLIKKVLSDELLLEQIQEKFDITIKVDKSQDDYYYLVSLLAAYHSHNAQNQEGFGPDDIAGLAAEYEIRKLAELPRASVEALMEEMQELNILKRLGNGRYRFARFRFLQMMGSVQTIEDKILEYGEEG